MKKLLLLLLVLSITLCSCSKINKETINEFTYKIWDFFTTSKEEVVNEYMNNLIDALEADDKEAVKALFSQTVISEHKTFDSELDDLMLYFEGEAEPYNDDLVVHTHKERHKDGSKYELSDGGTIKTTKHTYSISFSITVEDSEDSDNIGFSYFDIIKVENELGKENSTYNYDEGVVRCVADRIIYVDINNYYKYLPKIYSDTSEVTNIYINNILTALENNDEFYIRYYFSRSYSEILLDGAEKSTDAVEYFDGITEPFMDKVDIDFTTNTVEYAPEDPNYKENGYKQTFGTFSFDVPTIQGDVYRFAIKICYEDESDEMNRGLISLYILKADENTDLKIPYYGDGLFTPGINIGVPNYRNK